MHIKSVWEDIIDDIEGLHQQERHFIASALDQLLKTSQPLAPLGIVIAGEGGVGKTHLIGAIRKYTITHGLNFILVDMTDVRDFWETVLQGYISSLQEDAVDGTAQFQLRDLVGYLVSLTGKSVSSGVMAALPEKSLRNAIKHVLNALAQVDRKAAAEFQDVIRALILLNSDSFEILGIGHTWLQGLEIETEDKTRFGFRQTIATSPRKIVQGLSWLMSLQRPSVLALDQLDSIVMQHHYGAGGSTDLDLSEEQRISKAIIEGIGGGLMALRDTIYRTQIIVSCLESTWNVLVNQAISTFQDRFHRPLILGRVISSEVARAIVEKRLQQAYEQVGFVAPYSTWPFSKSFFQSAIRHSPRRILKRCYEHQQHCLVAGEIQEIHSFGNDVVIDDPPVDLEAIDQAFATAQQQVDIRAALDETQEDAVLGQWLQTAAKCLVAENPTPDTVDSEVEVNFPGGKNYPQLHARVRLIYRNEGDREKHLSLRALLRSHHAAYRARLKTAMTTAGIDHALSFRRLLIVRVGDIPGGATTQELSHRFTEAGGLMVYPDEAELRLLAALHQIRSMEHFDTWLHQRRPVSQLRCFQSTVTWLFGDTVDVFSSGKTVSSGTLDSPPQPAPDKPDELPLKSPHSGDHPVAPSPVGLPIGRQLRQPQDIVAIPLEALTKHIVILAGSGAGKTVLVRRLVEEAILKQIPAIVIDGANDLARMGDPWPETPAAWDHLDRRQAQQYHQSVDVAVWTPGREAGNAVTLNPLPDFAALTNNADELNQAIDMARDSLQDIVASGNSATAKVRRGILRNALEVFATNGGGDLEGFADFLRDLPEDAAGNISRASQHAQAMADLLSAEMANNPLLRQSGAPLAPAILLGLEGSSAKTRLSILNFIGLSGLPQQQQFLHQLAMTLFTWIKKHPAPAGQPLRGLLVIDEAKDFLPSRQSTPCKSSLNRLAAQARKYGLGLIFATQAPKSIDHNIIANCSTQFYGRSNSPAAIDVVRDQLQQRGGQGDDIAQLQRGEFYAVSESINPPIKITVPLCLSFHPPTPLDESEVLERAKQSRQ
ncbi:ATP-binding protein [Halomicronema hongdechloris]|nr:ATP-binding protein [Halomicronema hongdechloris]